MSDYMNGVGNPEWAMSPVEVCVSIGAQLYNEIRRDLVDG